MKSLETREGQAESHFRVACGVYDRALQLYKDGPDRILPHPNPDFRSARNQIRELLYEADSNLRYAVDFAMPDVEAIKELKEKILDLREKLQQSGNN